MSTTTTAPAEAPAASRRGPRLRGLAWLVWRQHRAAFWTGIAVSVAALAWFAYQRTELVDYLAGLDGPLVPGYKGWAPDFLEQSSRLSDAATALGAVAPVLVGVFLGAPLLANDLEHGTGKLVWSQSVSRGRWLAAKLGMAVLVVTACTAALSAAFGWWLAPAGEADSFLYWSVGRATGPVPVALSLFLLVAGAAIGMLLRRTLLSMVVTFGFALAVQIVWTTGWKDFGDTAIATTRTGTGRGAELPDLPPAALDMDKFLLTGSGERLDWYGCAKQSEEAARACMEKKDVIGYVVEYLPVSERTSMLWTGSALLLSLTAAVAVFIFWWGRKRLH